ncbi:MULTISPECIES: hypothetical protein [unclassified Thiocapsa]|uniref:hypothetical protein n=1 Tax=unclassified Thiocapsa TaxID=2641286 RepID=UPI0035B27716
MRHSSNILIPILIALLTVAAWALLNRPADEPPWPNRIQGFSFAPLRAHNDPAHKSFPTTEEIDEDLALLQGTVHAVRTYSVESTLSAIPRLAAARGLNVTLGAWIGSDPDANETELARFGEILSKGYRNLVRVMVGNEAILREDVSVAELTQYLDRVRKMTWLPVSTAEPWHVWL